MKLDERFTASTTKKIWKPGSVVPGAMTLFLRSRYRTGDPLRVKRGYVMFARALKCFSGLTAAYLIDCRDVRHSD